MYPPVKRKLLERIKEGMISIVVYSSYQNYKVDLESHRIKENTVQISAWKYEKLGIVRDFSDDYFLQTT